MLELVGAPHLQPGGIKFRVYTPHLQRTESDEEVRELQALTVHFSERVVKLQTLLQVQIPPQTDGIPSGTHRPGAAQQPAVS